MLGMILSQASLTQGPGLKVKVIVAIFSKTFHCYSAYIYWWILM